MQDKDIFCKIIDGEIDSKKFFEDEYVIGIMDANPDSPGHVLIIPKNHFEDVVKMDMESLAHVYKIAKKISQVMMISYPNIDGVVQVVNYGKPQIIKHLHLHLIPTYEKEVNLSQDEACELLKKELSKI